MNPLLDQFQSEGRELLEGISEKLLHLERAPDDPGVMDELFRFVHTLKGNSGLFELPQMTRVLHAGEDLLDAVRDGKQPFSAALADQLLEAMDFVAAMFDEIGDGDSASLPDPGWQAEPATQLAAALRAHLQSTPPAGRPDSAGPDAPAAAGQDAPIPETLPDQSTLAALPEVARMALYRRILVGASCHVLVYEPEAESFFKGEDPFFQISQLPEPLWRRISAREPWPALAELDAYHCVLRFELVLESSADELAEHFRYVPEQVRILAIQPEQLPLPQGRLDDGPMTANFIRAALTQVDARQTDALQRAARALLELSAPDLCIASGLRWLLLVLELEPDNRERLRDLLGAIEHHCLGTPVHDARLAPSAARTAAGPETIASLPPEWRHSLEQALAAQRQILALEERPDWFQGRLRAVAASLNGLCRALGAESALEALAQATAQAEAQADSAPLRDWLTHHDFALPTIDSPPELPAESPAGSAADAAAPSVRQPAAPVPATGATPSDEPVRFGRRAEDQAGTPRTLKVDQVKIDRLMGLVGEMVVAKNALPYLAGRAEEHYRVRELSREIKTQYSVINRIAEEMQDAMMQVRLLPVSFIFQRFPRLVRDIAHKLGKEVELVMQGESTEADKNIIEALAEPMIHILRNSLDHGLELPEEREAAGKPRGGKLEISAQPLSDRVLITIRDDGRGIDAEAIRRKAYEKGLIDEATAERLNEQEALNLIFAPGLSTAAKISDLSGRGVGMDVVRSAILRVKGSIDLRSQVGKGTELRLSLPLSMAVTNVMIIESARQRFGVPMEAVAETVRVARRDIHLIKHRQTTVLRGRVIPLLELNSLLGLDVPPVANEDDALAVLIARIEQDELGIIVDDCRETVDIILKPLEGFLGTLPGYAGTALLGDGSVLLVLNPTELL
ncbi:Chemotaxis protein CheA [Thiorhodovibrio winogradskyi]|uniref:histidine kinase n=1 Tax=Thiorhodovibrio winogradskyi TaxID=77007 RepID=A0ABZ0S5Y9_9GAMM|nr:chemotaxis protein CheA [Thiorhodovibrio winogradskyi]